MELDKNEFELIMTEIDEELSRKEIKIPGRPISALLNLFEKMNISGPLFHPFEEDLDFPVTETNASDHVHNWYSDSYGERLNIDVSPASFPVYLKGSCYEVKLPLAIGDFLIVSSKHKIGNEKVINCVDFVQKMTNKVRANLTENEEATIQVMSITCLGVANEFKKHKTELLSSAEDDSLISCELLCGYNTNPSLSSWHSLQMAEKCIKEYIKRKNVKFSKIHDINKLRDEAIAVGYKPDSKINWDVFDFNASVRYSPDSIKMNFAVRINHEAWRVAFNSLKQIKD